MANPTERDRRRDLVKLHLSAEFLVAIGTIAVRAAILDAKIEMLLQLMARAYPKTVQQRADSLSTEQKLQVIKETLVRDLPRHKHAISEFVSEVAAARLERHAIIHSIWGKTDTEAAKNLLDYRVWKVARPTKRVTVASMMNLATQMIDLSFEFSDWQALQTAVHLHRRAASLRMPQPLERLPSPPRSSDLDYEERLRHRGLQPDTSEC